MTGTSTVPILVAILIVVRTRKMLNKFSDSGATSASMAKSPEELGIRQSFIFSKFVRRGILIPATDNKFYLNEENLAEYQRKKRTLVIPLVLLLFMLLALDFYLFNN